MEVINKSDSKIIISDENKLYTFINMGSFVGHKTREWWATPEDYWKLMFLDEVDNEKVVSHIEALINDSGGYIRIISELNGAKRIIQIENNAVYSDVIEVSEISKRYTAIDKEYYDNDKVPIFDYFNGDIKFYSDDKKEYEGKIPDNMSIIEFLVKNEELVPNLSGKNY